MVCRQDEALRASTGHSRVGTSVIDSLAAASGDIFLEVSLWPNLRITSRRRTITQRQSAYGNTYTTVAAD
jgi:hypothetical protein